MKIKEFFKKHIVFVFALVLLAGFGIGALVFHSGHSRHSASVDNGKTWYTCSMHPQIRQDHPGKCPICGMELIPVDKKGVSASDGTNNDPNTVEMSDEAVALANIETQVVGTGTLNREVRLFGKIQPDERQEQVQSAYVAGRIERLMINAVGDRVSRGQTLAVIYSPELYSTEQELVAALTYPVSPQRKTLIEAAAEKLSLLNVTSAQIRQIIRTRKPSPYMALKANTNGTVVEKNIEQGDYVNQGAPLLKIADLSTVWAVFQAYEGDLPFVQKGAAIHFTSDAIPGRTFTGRVSFIDPILNGNTRTAGVRVVMNNPGGIFKPEMIITGNAVADLTKYRGDIIVPKSAVLWTGRRSVVYVKENGTKVPTFTLRQVVLGPAAGDCYIIEDGLAEGEEIVTNGTFAVDASAQLAGKKNMMDQN